MRGHTNKNRSGRPSWMPRNTTTTPSTEESSSYGEDVHYGVGDDWSSTDDVATEDEEEHQVYLIHWRRETGVSDWNVMNVVAQVELRDQSAPRVMQNVKDEMIETTAGIQTSQGIYDKVYRHADDAIAMGLTDCMRHHLQLTRRGIREVLGLTMTEYYELLKKKEINELRNDNYPGVFHRRPSSQRHKKHQSHSLNESYCSSQSTPGSEDGHDVHVRDKTLLNESHDSSSSHATFQKNRKGCLIQWGMNSLYNDRTAPDLHLCNQIMTDLQMWIECKTLY